MPIVLVFRCSIVGFGDRLFSGIVVQPGLVRLHREVGGIEVLKVVYGVDLLLQLEVFVALAGLSRCLKLGDHLGVEG